MRILWAVKYISEVYISIYIHISEDESVNPQDSWWKQKPGLKVLYYLTFINPHSNQGTSMVLQISWYQHQLSADILQHSKSLGIPWGTITLNRGPLKKICIYVCTWNGISGSFSRGLASFLDSSFVNYPISRNRVKYHDFSIVEIDSCLLLAEYPLFSLYKSSNTQVYFPSILALRNLSPISHHQSRFTALVLLSITVCPLTSDD